MATKAGSDIKDTLPKGLLLALDLYLELDIICHRASLKLLQLNAGKPNCCSVYGQDINTSYRQRCRLIT